MKTQFQVSIKSPCTENFNHFAPTKEGGFCNSCQKEVIDFSTMKAKEITKYFKTHSGQNTCGRFNSKQLTSYTYSEPHKRKISFISSLAISFIALFSLAKGQAQTIKSNDELGAVNPIRNQTIAIENNITVKGVVSEDGTPLPGANVVLEGTAIGTSTDFDGKFEFPEPLKKGDVLVFSYLGFTSKKVVIKDGNSAKDITLQVNLKADSCILMGAVAVKKVYKSK